MGCQVYYFLWLLCKIEFYCTHSLYPYEGSYLLWPKVLLKRWKMWFGFLATHDDIIPWNSSKSWDRFVYLPYMRIGLLFSFHLLNQTLKTIYQDGEHVSREMRHFSKCY